MTVGSRFPVELDGRPYVVDLDGYQRSSIEMIRQQGESSPEYGEGSLNPLDLWRRSQSDWSGGAGQLHLDKWPETQRDRYFESSGVDPWERGEVSLSRAAVPVGPAITSSIKLLSVAGVSHYVTFGSGVWRLMRLNVDIEYGSGKHPSNSLYPANDLYPRSVEDASTQVVAGNGAAQDAVTDGHNVYVITNSNTQQTNVNGDSVSTISSTGGQIGAYYKGRLLVANYSRLYNVTGTDGSAGTEITPETLNNDWRWRAFGEGPNHIYAGGVSGDRSAIYATTVQEDGVGLTTPRVACELPTGEEIRSIHGYVGVVLLGTNRGLRVAQPTGDGGLQYGGAIEIGRCESMAAHGNQVWCLFRGTAPGVGVWTKIVRADLGSFPDPDRPLVPAYAEESWNEDSDRSWIGTSIIREQPGNLIVSDGRPVWWVAPYSNPDTTWLARIVCMSNSGYAESGELTTSWMTFDLPDDKVAETMLLRFEPLRSGERFEVRVETDQDHEDVVFDSPGSTGGEAPIGGLRGERFRVRIRLVRSRTDEGRTPVLTRGTLRAYPRPSGRGELLQVPLVVHEAVKDTAGNDYFYDDPLDEFWRIKELEMRGDPVDYREWGRLYRAFVDNVQLGPGLFATGRGESVQGGVTLLLRVFDGVQEEQGQMIARTFGSAEEVEGDDDVGSPDDDFDDDDDGQDIGPVPDSGLL